MDIPVIVNLSNNTHRQKQTYNHAQKKCIMTSFAVNIDNDSNDWGGFRRPNTSAGADREEASL